MFTKTVDSITKVFTQAIKDLEALEVNNGIRLSEVTKKQAKLVQEEQDIQLESKRASDVRTKLLSIVG